MSSDTSQPSDPYKAAVPDGEIQLTATQHALGLACGVIIWTLATMTGSAAVWFGAELLLSMNGHTAPGKPFKDQLSLQFLAAILAGVMCIAALSFILALQSKRRLENGFRRSRQVEQKRIRLGYQAAALQQVLREQKTQQRESL